MLKNLVFSLSLSIAFALCKPIEEASLACGTNNTCYNGGYLARGVCQCPAFTIGQCCEKIQCQNYGIQTGNYCMCPPGWYSTFCQRRGSIPHIMDDLDFSKRSFVLVINAVETMQSARDAIVLQLNTMLDKIEPSIISNYMIKFYATFTQSGSSSLMTYDKTLMTTNRTEFVNYVSSNWIQLNESSQSSPTQETLKAISQVQSYSQWSSQPPSRLQWVSPKSTILVFTDRADVSESAESFDISDGSMEHRLIEQTLFWGNRPIIFFLQNDAPAVNLESENYLAYRRYIESTNGELITTQISEISLLMNMVPHLMKNELMVSYSFVNSRAIQIDRNLGDSNTAQYMLISYHDEHGANFTFPNAVSDSKIGTSVVSGNKWQLYNLISGKPFTINVPNNTTLSVKVFVQSDVTLIHSISDAPHADSDGIINYNGTSAFIVAQYIPIINSMEVIEVSVQFTSTSNDTAWKSLVGMQTTNSSTFQIIFSQFSQCHPGPYMHRFNLQMANGDIITRLNPGYCSYPASAPSGEECESSGDPRQELDSGYQCDTSDLSGFNQPRFHSYRQIVFAVELTKGMKNSGALQSLINMVPKLIAEIGSVEGTFFTLVTFSDQTIMDQICEYSVGNFIDSFISALSIASPRDNGNNAVYSQQAVMEAIKIGIVSPMQINVFTRSPSVKYVGDLILPRCVQVNYYVISNDVDHESSKRVLQRQSGGRLISIRSEDIQSMQNLLLYSTQENALLSDDAQNDCRSSPFELDVLVDNFSSYVTLTIYGEGVKLLNMSYTQGTVPYTNIFSSPNSAAILIDLKNLTIIEMHAQITTSNGPCFAQFRAVSSLNFALGFTEHTLPSTVATIPFSRRGINSAANTLVHTSQTDFKSLSVLIAPTNFNAPWSTKTNISTYNFFQKNLQCSYQFSTWTMEIPNADNLKALVSGQLSDSTFFQRMFFYYTPSGDHMCGANPIDTYGQCICDQYHQGEFCDQPICRNGGTASKDICICTISYHGDFCEYDAYGNVYSTIGTTAATSSESTTHMKSTTTKTAGVIGSLSCVLLFLFVYVISC